MKITEQKFAGLCALTHSELEGSWLIQSPSKKSWLADAAAKAVDGESDVHAGANDPTSTARSAMARVVRARIMAENEKCGFVILPIILAAVLSWLVWRLLDLLFLSEDSKCSL